METRKIHVKDLSTVTGIQQYEHAVQSIFFLGLEDFEGEIYLSMESDDYSNAVPLAGNTFVIGQPMTKYNTTYTCQIYGILNSGEKIQLSKRFRLMVDKSNDIESESSDYPVDPNFKSNIDAYFDEKYTELDTFTDTQKSEIESTGQSVIASIPSDYSALVDELTDIRVGADGTIYPTAGDAVRGQIGDLSDDLVKKSLLFDEVQQEEDSVSISIITSGSASNQVKNLYNTVSQKEKGLKVRPSTYLGYMDNQVSFVMPVTGGHTYRFVMEDIESSVGNETSLIGRILVSSGFDDTFTTMYADMPDTQGSESISTTNNDTRIFRTTNKVVVPSGFNYLIFTTSASNVERIGNWGVYDYTEYPIDVTSYSQLVDNPSSDSYTVTYNLTNANSSNSAPSVATGSTYTTTITPSIDYSLDEVKVTVGGVDYTPVNRVITITDVSYPITISATGVINEGYVGKYEIKEELIPSDLLYGKLDTPTGLPSADSGKVLYTDGNGGLEIGDLPNKNYPIEMEWVDFESTSWKAGYYYDTSGVYTQATTEAVWGTAYTRAVSCTDYTDLIDVNPMEKWHYTNPHIHLDGADYIPNVILFDENKAVIDTLYFATESDFVIPSNGKYMALNYYNSQAYSLKKMGIRPYDDFEIQNDVDSHYRLFRQLPSPTLNTLSKGYICVGTDDLRMAETKPLHEMYTNANVPYYMAAIPSAMKNVAIGGTYQTNLDYARLCVANGGEIVTHNGAPITADNIDDFETKYEYFAVAKKRLEEYGFKVRGIFKAGGTGAISNDPRLNSWCTKYYDYSDQFGDGYPYFKARRDFEYVTETEIDNYVADICNNHGYVYFYAHTCSATVQSRFQYLLTKLAEHDSSTYEFTTPSHLYDLMMG